MNCTISYFLGIFGFSVALLVSIKLYIKLTTGWCKSQKCLLGKTAIITGANTGIGFQTALDFAKRGARVILACRNQQRAEEARSKIIKETGNSNVIVKLIDMTSLDSVRIFAKEIKATEDRLDILVNNAGVFGIGTKKTKDGNDLSFQVNHLSAFLLTNLLIGLLKKSGASRVVNVSSRLASLTKNFELAKLNSGNSHLQAYASSKLCNILFTIELAKKLRDTEVTTYSLHPGAVKTEIFRYGVGVTKLFEALITALFYINCESGAQNTIFCSVTKGIEGQSGQHFAHCRKIKPYKIVTRHLKLTQKLWELSEKLTKLKVEEKI